MCSSDLAKSDQPMDNQGRNRNDMERSIEEGDNPVGEGELIILE